MRCIGGPADGSPRSTCAPAGAYWRMYALRTASVRFGPVMWGVSDENTSALPARTGAGRAGVGGSSKHS